MRFFLCIGLTFSVLQAQEYFFVKDIYPYLNKNNPFYYQAIGEQYIAQGKVLMSEGALDTQVNALYDNKRYPVTSGSYGEMGILKPMSNGVEVSVGYRSAQGTQEYNNIKTGKDGEFISSIKIPLFSVLYDISKNKVDIQTAHLNMKQAKYQSDFNVLGLYYNIAKIYYQMLLQKQLVATQYDLLKKAKVTSGFIQKQIKIGAIPRVMNIEMEQIIVQREQAYLYEKNNLKMVKNIFLQYIGMDIKAFDKKYILPTLKHSNETLMPLQRAIKTSIANRPDLKVIESKAEQLSLQKQYNRLEGYPKFDMKFSAIYDPINNDGYKISFNLNVPIERRKYHGTKEVLRHKNLVLQSQKLKARRELKTNMMNAYQKIKTKKVGIRFLKKEFSLAHKLEAIEMKKIHEGVGNLISLNQREIASLQVKQKLLQNYYELKTYFLEVTYLLGKYEFK